MSCEVFKAGVYFIIPGLKNKRNKEIVEFFIKIGCRLEYPENIEDMDDEDPLYFHEEIGLLHPRNVEIDCEGNTQWIIECPLIYDSTNQTEQSFAISITHMNKIAKYVENKLGISVDPIAFAYTWYSGTDEPFYFPDSVLETIKVNLRDK
jgi:hypothetical protein